MNGELVLTTNTLAYGDSTPTNNPSERFTDWSKKVSVSVENPQSNPYVIAPGASLVAFNGTRATSVANNTEFELALSPLSWDRYRFTWTGTGTNPGFRTNRNIDLSTQTVVIAVLANNTITMTAEDSGSFTSVQVGDTVLIPGVTTGDPTSPFNVLNEGYWTVLGKTGSTVLQLVRFPGESFSGYGESVSVTDPGQVLAYSTAGVQIGDSVNISAGFSSTVKKSYTVVAVTPEWFEVISTLALPDETAVPTAAGIIFYTAAKRFVQAFYNQQCMLQFNGTSDTSLVLVPWTANDSEFVGEFKKVGPSWSLTITNTSTAPLEIILLTAE